MLVIFVASQVFVKPLEWAGPQLRLSATVTALLLSPIATELPEIMNALLWVRQGKTDLVLANISGAMMIQATAPSGIGLLFTPWLFHAPLILAALVTMVAIGYLLATMRAGQLTATRLAAAAGFYIAFATGLFFLADKIWTGVARMCAAPGARRSPRRHPTMDARNTSRCSRQLRRRAVDAADRLDGAG